MALGLGPMGCMRPAKYTAEIQQYQYTQLHLGVQVRILVFAEKETVAQEAARSAFQRIATLEDIFSNYRPTSELSHLVTTSYNKSSKVTKELFMVLRESIGFSKETAGAFDVTVGPFTDLWRKSRQQGRLPSPDTLAVLQNRVGWPLIVLNEEEQSILLKAPGMQIDMGGIAKGYILDEALQSLRQSGIQSALIEAGGDIVVGDPPPGKTGWTIEVPDAPADAPIVQKAASLKNAAIATSGDTEQFVEIDGTRYAHIIDPRTGLGTTTRRKATVIAPNGITADRFATALTVMDRTAASALLSNHPEVQAFVRVVE